MFVFNQIGESILDSKDEKHIIIEDVALISSEIKEHKDTKSLTIKDSVFSLPSEIGKLS